VEPPEREFRIGVRLPPFVPRGIEVPSIKETFMKTKFVAAVAVFAVLSAPAFAQDKAAPKASKADVQKLVDSIKGDKAKTAQFCSIMKLQGEYQAAAEKKDDKKLEALDKQMEDESKKLGPDFDKVTSSEIDDESAALLDDLSKTCK
jgi:Skp family chaperone for outer membrane proteins